MVVEEVNILFGRLLLVTLRWVVRVAARQVRLMMHRGRFVVLLEVLDHEPVVPLILGLSHELGLAAL